MIQNRKDIMANPLGSIGGIPKFPVDVPHLMELIRTRCTSDANGCLTWTGYCIKGYPQGGMFRKMRLLHRALYISVHGEIPAGLQVDHTCNNTKCLNIDHLEPKTARENILRSNNACARHARQEKCIHGHEFDGIKIDKKGRKSRTCSTCMRFYRTNWRERNGV